MSQEIDLAYWKWRVVQSCIYGVDLNPLAVELAKLSLWLSTVARNRPLSFLDHHLHTGNALIGARLADLVVAPGGNGSSRKTRKPEKAEKAETQQEQLSLFDDETFRQNMTSAVSLMWLVEDSPAQTVAQVKEQEQLYAHMREELIGKYGNIANLFTAHYYGLTVDPKLWKPLFDFATGRILSAPAQFQQWLDAAKALVEQPRTHFFHWELEFPEVFFDKHGQPKRGQAGFDAVIGNPPWIRQEAFSEDKPALKHLYSVYHGVADLSTYFVELGNAFLKESGRFGFIIPNKFVRANYGGALRTFLTSRVKLEQLVDFGDLPVFPDAVTYPLIVLTSKQASDGSPVKYAHLEQLHPDALASDIEQSASLLPTAMFSESHWVLSGAGKQAIIEKMRAISTPLGEYINNRILYGIKTGFNEAFVIDRNTRNALIAADPKSAEIIKPFLVGEDVKRYHAEHKGRYIILSKIGTPMDQYPAVFAHLQQYQEKLEKRWDKGNHWWELRSCDYYEEFEKPKIMWPVIAASNKFAFSRDGYYSNDKTFFIPTDSLYLLAILNSSTAFLFFRSQLTGLRGDFFEYRAQTLEHTPIRRIAFTTPAGERIARVQEGMKLYEVGKQAELLALVEAEGETEQGDVVHDLLAQLAERMIDLHARRQAAVEDFVYDLKAELTDAQLARIQRLWTPLNAPQEGDVAAGKRFETARQKLGALSQRQLDLRDDIGALDEQQWEWLLRERLSAGHNSYSLSRLMRIFQKDQPIIAALDQHITRADKLIDQVVYRLYGLTSEEIAVVEGI